MPIMSIIVLDMSFMFEKMISLTKRLSTQLEKAIETREEAKYQFIALKICSFNWN